MKCECCTKKKSSYEVTLKNKHLQQQYKLCNLCFKENEPQFKRYTKEWRVMNQSNSKKTTDSKHPFGCEFLTDMHQNRVSSEMACFGREVDLEIVMDILHKKKKGNVLLVGEPGVGKTALVEGLVWAIESGNVSSKFSTKKVMELSVSGLMKGTYLRGILEGKVEELVMMLKKETDIVLFIDEIHMLMEKGKADIVNMLKPLLGKEGIHVIGATTSKEYKQIEKDKAFMRRFEVYRLQELDEHHTLQVMEKIKGEYETYHGVTYTEEALQECVLLSKKYILNRYFPDKAIDLMDVVGATISKKKGTHQSKQQMIALEKKRLYAEKKMMESVRNPDRLAHIKLQARGLLLESWEKELQWTKKVEITKEDVREIFEKNQGVRVRTDEEQKKDLMHLEERIKAKIIGQDAPIHEMVSLLKKKIFFGGEEERPVASLMISGTTGIGKTEFSKVLAAEMRGGEEYLVRLDMSEYMEQHSVSKLIGSPPGYIGYHEGGYLTEAIKKKPDAILLIDEIEKAHPDVLNLFLQLMDYGILKNSEGEVISFRNVIVVATTNVMMTASEKNIRGFEAGDSSDSGMAERLGNLENRFKKEFLARFDSIVAFQELDESDLMKVLETELSKIEKKLLEKGYGFVFDELSKRKLVSAAVQSQFGVRGLKRLLSKEMESKMIECIFSTESQREQGTKKQMTVTVRCDEKGQFVCSVERFC